MQIKTETDPQKGAGFALFTLSLRNTESFPLEDAITGFTLQSSSTRAYWSDGEWGHGKTGFTPDSFVNTDGKLKLFLGPGIVDKLDPIETYQLCVLYKEGQEVCGIFFLENVTPSLVLRKPIVSSQEAPKAMQRHMGIPTFPEAEKVAGPEVNKPAPQALSLSLEKNTEGVAEPFIKISSEALQSAVNEPEQVSSNILEEKTLDKEKSLPRNPLTLFLYLLLSVCALFVLYWGFTSDTEPSPSEHASSSFDSSPVTLENIKKLVAENASFNTLLTVFAKSEWTNENADARFLLAEVLATKYEYGPAMSVIGHFYDPSFTALSAGTIIKDPEQAVHWYKKALGAGVGGINASLVSLYQWIKKEAAAGNEQAKHLQKQLSL